MSDFRDHDSASTRPRLRDSEPPKSAAPRMIVGVAAPMGSVMLGELIEGLGSDFPFAVVVAWTANHGDATGENPKPRIGRYEHEPIPGDGDVAVMPGRVYACDGPAAINLAAGRLSIVQLDADERGAPIDHFFECLADQCREFAVGVTLSQRGTDGAMGLRQISDQGGMTIAGTRTIASVRHHPLNEDRPKEELANEDSAKGDSAKGESAKGDSPALAGTSAGVSLAAMGGFDHILSPADIAVELIQHAEHMLQTQTENDHGDLNRQIMVAIPLIAATIEKHTDNDFKHYKTTTMVRRIRRRIQILKMTDVGAYIQVLRTSREEALRLFRELLISVTAFFRDPDAFESLSRDVLRPLIANHTGDGPLKVWVPGCAAGQEAFSIAILIRERMDELGLSIPVQIFATDLDQRALAVARTGSYPIGIQDEITADRLQRYFVKRGNRYFVNKQVRDMVVFAAHNLISDPPFTKVDLVSCRNVLIYLGSHLQKKLIPLFHYSIKPSGYLFLGPSETLSVNKDLFRVLQMKHRLFQRRVTAIDRPHDFDLPSLNVDRFGGCDDDATGEVDLFRYTQQVVLGEFSPQWVVADDDGQIHTLSSDPAPFLKMSGGMFKNDVISMVHENLRIGLRAAFTEARTKRRRVLAQDLSVPVDGGLQRVHITVQPMPELGEAGSLHLIAFHRIGTPLIPPSEDADRDETTNRVSIDQTAGKIIEQLESELTQTREALERSVQELEASNEELKASNEELLSMNEELQSANEELETSKEELQTSNDSLVRSNNDTANLLRSTAIATIFLDANGCIRSFTPAATEIYRMIDTDIGRPLDDLKCLANDMPPIDLDAVAGASVAGASVAGSPAAELPAPARVDTVQLTDGRWFTRRVSAYRAVDQRVDGVVLTFTEVTEIRGLQQRLEMALEAGELGAWELDVPTGKAWHSPEHDRIFGYDSPHPNWTIQTFLSHVIDEDKDRVAQFFTEQTPSQTQWSIECRIRRVDGEVRWIRPHGRTVRDEQGKAIRMYGTVTDITERKTAENALRASENLIRTIAENSTQALIMMDANGFVTYCNQACLDMTGFDNDEIRSAPLHDLIHHHYPDGRPYPIHECPIDRALPEDQSVRAHEDLFFRKDGSSFPVLCAVSPIFRDGVPVSSVVEVRDITEQKQYTQNLQQAREAAEIANESKSLFLANMSHEIRTPMTAILGYSEMIADKIRDEEALNHVRTIRRNGDFLLEIINDILDLSKIEAGKLEINQECFSPVSLVEDVRSIMQVRASERELKLDVHYADDLPPVIRSDPKRLKQILINLVGNAIKFTRRGGVAIRLQSFNKRIRIEIEDSGIGISPEQQARLFQPFSQGDGKVNREFGGTGLGLAISHRLTEMLGGKIEVQSEPERGSTFSVSIDIGEVDPGEVFVNPAAQPSSALDEDITLSGHILVVDDRRDIRFLSGSILRGAGAEISEAEDGQAALAAVEEFRQVNKPVDLILLDMQMPRLDGYQTAESLRRLGYDGPIIALTADAMQGDMSRCMDSGCNDYLSKPIDRQTLLTKVRNFMIPGDL